MVQTKTKRESKFDQVFLLLAGAFSIHFEQLRQTPGPAQPVSGMDGVHKGPEEWRRGDTPICFDASARP